MSAWPKGDSTRATRTVSQVGGTRRPWSARALLVPSPCGTWARGKCSVAKCGVAKRLLAEYEPVTVILLLSPVPQSEIERL